MSIEVPVPLLSIELFNRSNVTLKYWEKERAIAIEFMEDGLRTRMSMKNWDISSVFVKKSEREYPYVQYHNCIHTFKLRKFRATVRVLTF